jgi:3-deoxy-manno-octulosonate cytidylyltransferase (CMP-KDO synthetase)
MRRERPSVVVPFRLASSRFPNKALCSFRGRPLLEHALRIAAALEPRELVVTAPASDLEQAGQVVNLGQSGARVLPSGEGCASATERLVQIRTELMGDPIVSLPVDEPAVDPAEILRAMAEPDAFGAAEALTFWCDFVAPEDYQSALSAKVVLDRAGMLLYMSRAIIPVAKDGSVDRAQLKKNVGVFVFRSRFLERLAELAEVETILDRHEGLEQLRWLELGLAVRCARIRHVGFGIDVPEQLQQLDRRLP